MDMKKILQSMDGASTKPVEGSNDMKKFLSVMSEGASPHKVTLPVQMAMQHYAEPKVEQPKTIKEVKKSAMSGMLYQYYTNVEQELVEAEQTRKEIISEQARSIAQRVLAKESFNPEYDDEAGMAQGSLHTLKRAVDGLMSTIDDKENLPEWCQEKISLAEDYLVTVWDYLQSEKEQGVEMDESRYLSYHDELQRRERDEGDAMSRGRREVDDEANLMYVYKDGRLKQAMIDNHNERQAHAQGFRGTKEDALRLHGIIRSKFDPKKWVQKQGEKWIEVHPFGK